MNRNKINFKNINKLILFNLVYCCNSVLFWILFAFCAISQPLIEILLFFIKNEGILSYSLLIILLPLILSFVFILFQITILFHDSKNNSIEYKLVCSRYSKLTIVLSRVISVFITLLVLTLIQDLFLIFFEIVNMSKLGLTLFIANTFINTFIYLFILSFLALLSIKLNKIPFILVSLLIGIVTLGISLFSRPLIFKKFNFDYNNNNQLQYTRLVKDSNNLLVVKNKLLESDIQNSYYQIGLMKQINDVNLANNFIPSEWLMSFYSCLFLSMDFDFNFYDQTYNLLSIKLANKKLDVTPWKYTEYYTIRPNDINFSLLTNEQYSKLIFDNIDKIINKYSLIKNNLLLTYVYNNVISYADWNEMITDKVANASFIINFLKDATGINTEYNQLFYLIKYPNLISEKIPNLFTELTNKYNNLISDLFKYIFTNDLAKNNLFNGSQDILTTKKSLNNFYPNLDLISRQEPSISKDLDFIKNKLLKFSVYNNQITLSYLKNDLTYSLSNNELLKLKDLFPNIVYYNSLSNYIDSLRTY
ncbi:MAG: hypothetical protein K2K73_01030, partial [Ureaplasma sp.]|nr:hypothetical protein [Ureaplasma sp.]